MPFSFLPRVIFHSLTDIPPDYLHKRKIKLLMLDFDNTILPYTGQTPSKELLDWLTSMQNAGITLCVVSNSRKPKAIGFCEQNRLGCITRSKKPGGKGIRECLQKYGVNANEAALVGDQIFTDVLGANCAGVHSLLVKPIHLSNIWLKLRHVAEQPFILLAGKRRYKHDKP